MTDLIEYYRQCGSIKECARKFNVSPQKARRILIQSGEYSSPASSQINALYDQGRSAEEIAQALRMRPKTVLAYLPYTKGAYMSATPTANAVRIRACRERKKGAQKNG